MDPETQVAAAGAAIDALSTQTQTLAEQVALVDADETRTQEWKDSVREQLREGLFDAIRTSSATVESSIAAAHRQAEATLGAMRSPQDQAEVNAQSLAASRVQAALDKLAPAAAAQVFAEAGDVAALRALHAQVPVYVAVQLDGTTRDRAAVTRELQASVERQLEAVGTPDEAAAIRARRAGVEQRERLKAVTDYALHPSPGRRLALAYAESAGRESAVQHDRLQAESRFALSPTPANRIALAYAEGAGQ